MEILQQLLTNKSIKPKEKTTALCEHLLLHKLSAEELISFAAVTKDAIKATCVEGLALATQQLPELITPTVFDTIVGWLSEKAPRLKWECAAVLANTVHCYPKNLDRAIIGLLDNTQHTGTVVRWSAAKALAKIAELNTPHRKTLLLTLESICEREEKNSIKKIYLNAMKKFSKK